MTNFNKTKNTVLEALKHLEMLNSSGKISNVYLGFEKNNWKFENLSKDKIYKKVFETVVQDTFDELEKWKKEISLCNIQFNIELAEGDIGNNAIHISLKLNNTDKNCKINEIGFNYYINVLDDFKATAILRTNMNKEYHIEFPLSKEITKDIVLNEIVETFYDYVSSIKIEH